MWIYTLIFFSTFAIGQSQDATTTTASPNDLAKGEEKMSEYILQILEHFKQPNPVGIPGAKVPDPLRVPDMKQSVSIGTLYFKNTDVYGISKFRILYVNAEIGAMEMKLRVSGNKIFGTEIACIPDTNIGYLSSWKIEEFSRDLYADKVADHVVHAGLAIDKLQALGNYTMSTWLNRVQGPFTVDITGIQITAKANLGVERDGKLRAQEIKMDISFSTIAMNFENAGFFGGMLQGIVNTLGTLLFDSIKPFVLKEAYTKAREEINKKLDEVAGDMQFPNSISPLDMVIADVRKKIREMEMDPFKVKDYNATASVFTISLTHTWLTGLSSVQRVGNITLKMQNNTVIADFDVGTQKLEGTTQWELSAISGLLSRAGRSSFSVEYISGRIILAQPLDTRKKPEFVDLDLDIGNIQVRFDGAGTLDYVIEFVINVLPNLLRYQIIDALENPVIEKVQEELNKLNVEEMIKAELPKIDEMEESGLKLSALLVQTENEEPYDEDDFFNF